MHPHPSVLQERGIHQEKSGFQEQLALKDRLESVELAIKAESERPMPSWTRISDLKRQRLLLRDKLRRCGHANSGGDAQTVAVPA